MAIGSRTCECKKGYIFTLDAFLASAILIGGLLLISNVIIKEHPRESVEHLSADLLGSLAEIKMSDLNSTFVNNYLSSANTNMNLSVLEQLGTYWAVNETALAQNLSDYLISNILPKNTGMNLTMGSDSFFGKESSMMTDLYSADRMITGVIQGAPITGSTSSAYLRRISDKRTKSFAYFGGFVGQGNITVLLNEIPSDVNATDVTRISLEANAVAPFTLYINNINCAMLTPSNTTFMPDYWDVTNCSGMILPGDNNITLDFYGNLNEAYIMGGNLRVDYKTDQLQQPISMTSGTYNFPEIRGVVNLYDGFYIPGNLTNLSIYLHYLANHSILALNNTFFLTIGNTTVLIDTNSTSEQSITLDDALLSGIINYSDMNSKTIPLRLGFDNLTYDAQYIGNSKVMLITDRSGSMDWNMTYTGTNWVSGYPFSCPANPACGVLRECSDAAFNDSDTQRLSVAKCLGKQFSYDVLNITGNSIGLVSYSTSTFGGSTVNPTTNLTLLQDTIGTSVPLTGYSVGGSTCICCGINSAVDELTAGLGAITLIASGSSWKNNTNSFNGAPENDINGNAWFEYGYNDTGWSSGNAVLGHDGGGGGVAIITELGSGNFTVESFFPNLWENAGDVLGPPNDFTSNILNSSTNVFNITGPDDGWDWKGGVYGYDNMTNFTKVMNGRLGLSFRNYGWNNCSSFRCSGAYGIHVNITQEMYDVILNNGTAMLSFGYTWRRSGGSNYGLADQIWIKAKFISPTAEYWLGTQRDASHTGSDAEPEIATRDNPGNDFTGTALENLTSYITGPGLYYLHFGGKLLGHRRENYGNVTFDNVQIKVTNHTDHYYFRKHFNLTSTSLALRGVLNLLSDDMADIYINGNKVLTSTEKYNGTYWDRRGVYIDGRNFRQGDNVIAVDLLNANASAKFDLELIGINVSQQSAMLVMTDGQANVQCARQSTGSAENDAIKAACDAREDYGIQVFAVGFGSGSDESTLSGIADCGEGIYAQSDNTSALSDFYNQVVLNIISASVRSQTVVVGGGNFSASNLYPDSYISYNFTPVAADIMPNEISVQMQSSQFGNCSALVDIPPGIRIVDSKVTSYSAEHWTRSLVINSNVVYNLSEYDMNFTALGDPYLIQAPSQLLHSGLNQIYIDTGDDSLNNTGCSPNNTLIYTALVPSTTSRSGVVERTEGCLWTVQFQDDTFSNKSIPLDYAGPKRCSYTEANHTIADGAYDDADAYDVAVYNLLKALDLLGNGKIFVNLDSEDIEIVITTISSVPYLWGPSLIKASVWQ